MSVGDYVVHENHGLGIYRGIEKLEVDKKVKDYIKIEYQGGSNLYILATQLDMIQNMPERMPENQGSTSLEVRNGPEQRIESEVR